ncbi:MAG: NAD(+) synthase, partial [Planctomycetota bacterium]
PRTDPLTEADPNRLTLDALTLATRDYLHKSRFERAVIGLSGGIDSALTATIAARALGPESVVGAKMPSPISSEHSVTDAEDLADRLGIRLLSMPVDTARDGLAAAIDPALAELGQPPLGGQTPDLAAENLQSRARGALMMTLSNRTGSLMLTTGNKSELAVGYCTLYGDMNGALGVIGDLLKSRVFELARWINANHRACGFDRAPIPESTITKPPSAELAPGQLDQDTLPPYDILDQIIERFVEREQSPATIASQTGIARDLVETIVRMIDLNEYKRFQYAVVPKISPRAFGPGRRIPIVKR